MPKMFFVYLAIAIVCLMGNFSGSKANAMDMTPVVTQSEAVQVLESPRCRRYARYCHARHPSSHFRFRSCMALHGCR